MEEQASGSTSLRKIEQEQPYFIRARHTAGLFMLKQLTICRHSGYHNCDKFRKYFGAFHNIVMENLNRQELTDEDWRRHLFFHDQ